MTILYKIISKVITTILSPFLGKIVTPHQHKFIIGRSIYDNILSAMTDVHYAKFTSQECMLLQLNLDKSYNRIDWFFIINIMEALGFGSTMCWELLSFSLMEKLWALLM